MTKDMRSLSGSAAARPTDTRNKTQNNSISKEWLGGNSPCNIPAKRSQRCESIKASTGSGLDSRVWPGDLRRRETWTGLSEGVSLTGLGKDEQKRTADRTVAGP